MVESNSTPYALDGRDDVRGVDRGPRPEPLNGAGTKGMKVELDAGCRLPSRSDDSGGDGSSQNGNGGFSKTEQGGETGDESDDSDFEDRDFETQVERLSKRQEELRLYLRREFQNLLRYARLELSTAFCHSRVSLSDQATQKLYRSMFKAPDESNA